MASSGSDGSLSPLQTKRNMTNASSEEPAAKAPRKTQCLLNSVCKDLLLPIFKKFPTQTRVRMRQTCKSMNSYVEDERKVLAKTFLNSGISVELFVENSEILFKRDREISPFFPMCKFEEKVSGLPIKVLDLTVHDYSPFEVVEEAFKNLDIVAKSVYATFKEDTEDGLQKLLKLSNLVDVVDNFNFNIGPFDLVDFIRVFQQSRNVKKTSYACTNAARNAIISVDTDRTIVDMMKNFKIFELAHLQDSNFFNTFLWGIQSCHDINLNYVSFHFDDVSSSVFDHKDCPPTKMFWDLSSFPHHDTDAPFSIRLLSSLDKWILITEFLCPNSSFRDSNTVIIDFMNIGSESDFLEWLLDILYLDSTFTDRMKSDYLGASYEERFDMLRRAYYDRRIERHQFDEEEPYLTYAEYLEKEKRPDMRNL